MNKKVPDLPRGRQETDSPGDEQSLLDVRTLVVLILGGGAGCLAYWSGGWATAVLVCLALVTQWNMPASTNTAMISACSIREGPTGYRRDPLVVPDSVLVRPAGRRAGVRTA